MYTYVYTYMHIYVYIYIYMYIYIYVYIYTCTYMCVYVRLKILNTYPIFVLYPLKTVSQSGYIYIFKHIY